MNRSFERLLEILKKEEGLSEESIKEIGEALPGPAGKIIFTRDLTADERIVFIASCLKKYEEINMEIQHAFSLHCLASLPENVKKQINVFGVTKNYVLTCAYDEKLNIASKLVEDFIGKSIKVNIVQGDCDICTKMDCPNKFTSKQN